MNERIYELAKQAGFSSWVLNPSKETMSDTPELLDKFAELIVRECMNIVNPDDPRDGDTIKCILSLANMRLEKHFGVE